MNPEFLVAWLGLSEGERQERIFHERRDHYLRFWAAIERGGEPDLTLYWAGLRYPGVNDFPADIKEN